GCPWCVFFFSSRRRHTRFSRDWSSDVCSSDLFRAAVVSGPRPRATTSSQPIDLAALGEPVAALDGLLLVTTPYGLVADSWVRERSEERRVGRDGRPPGPRRTGPAAGASSTPRA